MPKPANVYRVFMIGESSVNYLMGDFPQFAARLDTELLGERRVELINAGGLSYGSHRLVLVTAEILNYEPDLVLFYLGHNEFEELEQLELAQPDRVAYQRLLYKSAFCRFIRDRLAMSYVRRLTREKNQRILATSDAHANLIATCKHEFTPAEIAERMNAFETNLSIMVSLCRERGVPVIMGTVPSNHFNPGLPADGYEEYAPVRECFRNGDYERGFALGREIVRRNPRHQSSDAENDIIRSIAMRFDVPLADVESAIIAAEAHHVPGETLFTDMCHLNAAGNKILLDVYYEEIVKLLREQGLATPAITGGVGSAAR